MLTMALQMRTLVVVLDGIDEAAGRRATISRFIREVLVPSGLRIVCTSRPEGVELADFKPRFVILDLKPLNDKQQQQAIDFQLEQNPFGKAFAEHLMAFSTIRQEHDRVYREEAFPSAEERDRIEGFKVPNLQFIDGVETGDRDPEVRQKTASGAFVAVSSEPEPRSKYLQEPCGVLTPKTLDAIDAALAKLPSDATEEVIKEAVLQVLGGRDAESPPVKVAQKLALLVLKRRKALDPSAAPPTSKAMQRSLAYLREHVPQTTAATLWPVIVARTDQFYETIEGLLPVFLKAMHELADKVGMDRNDLVLAESLKDPVRMHEKACDDYVVDFDDWANGKVIPESCVIDMIRGRAPAGSGRVMLALLDVLTKGFEVQLDGKRATLSLLRSKNKFADGGKNEPTRFRNMTTNMILSYDGRTVVAEMQIHHAAILKLNDLLHAHPNTQKNTRTSTHIRTTRSPKTRLTTPPTTLSSYAHRMYRAAHTHNGLASSTREAESVFLAAWRSRTQREQHKHKAVSHPVRLDAIRTRSRRVELVW